MLLASHANPIVKSPSPQLIILAGTTAHHAFRLALAILILLSLAAFWQGSGALEVLSDFRPYYLGGGLLGLCTLLLVGRRHWRSQRINLAGLILVIGVNGAEVGPVLLRSSPPLQQSGLRFTVAAFNVEASNDRHSDAIAWAQALDADVIMFSESTSTWADKLSPLRERFRHHLRIDELTMDVFSQHPLVRTQMSHFGKDRGFCLMQLSLTNLQMHLIAGHTNPRIPRGVEGFRQRAAALETGLPHLAGPLAGPVVVLGDLNVTPWSRVFRRCLQRSGLRDARRGTDALFTRHSHVFPASLLWNALDHCLVNNAVEVIEFRTGPDLGSDHLPVVASLRLPYR